MTPENVSFIGASSLNDLCNSSGGERRKADTASFSFSLLNPPPRFPIAVKKSLRGLQVIFIGCVWQITVIPKEPSCMIYDGADDGALKIDYL
jgi:hypothetical protein